MNTTRNTYWLIAGGINLCTAILHTIGGQLELVNPLMNSNLIDQQKAEWLAAWHLVTIILFSTSYVFFKNGIGKSRNIQTEIIQHMGILYIAFAVPFIVSSIFYKLFAPQWILLLPIGIVALFGVKQTNGKHS